jgi:exopolysaccharide biosynthesis polyprenyl glycosylphosphotransferase
MALRRVMVKRATFEAGDAGSGVVVPAPPVVDRGPAPSVLRPVGVPPGAEPESRASGPRPLRASVSKGIVVAADILTITMAMFLAYRLRVLFDGAEVIADAERHLLVGTLSVPLWVLVFRRYKLYKARHVLHSGEELGRIVHAVAVAVLVQAGVAFALRSYVARGWLALTFVTAVLLVSLERALLRSLFNRLRQRGNLSRPVVIVGGNAEGTKLCETFLRNRMLGYHVVGFVDDRAALGSYLVDHRPVLGLVDQTLDVVARTGASGVIIATTAIESEASNQLTRKLVERGIHVELSCSLHDIAPERLTVRNFGGHALLYVRPICHHGWQSTAKRAFDLVVASTLLVLALPILVPAALAIRLTSRGPVLFRQLRVGQGGEQFPMLKLRTMVHDAETRLAGLRAHNEADGPLFKMRADPRVTRVGRILRRLSIDELPQLWNVIRGDMSLVGPRPALPEEMTAWGPDVHQRLRVKPGITGIWQVSGRSNRSFEDYTRLDLYYVDNWSLWRDVVILLRTLPALAFRRGAY